MHQFRKTISALSIIFSVTLMGEYKISIIYESGFEFKSQHLLINDLKECSSKKEIENLVSDQDWIKDYYLAYKPFKKEIYLNIKNREPIFILNNKFFYDRKLSKFEYDNSKRNLILVEGPVDNPEDILKLIREIESIPNIQFKIQTINYSYVNGWDVNSDKTLIRFGNTLTEKRFKNFRDTSKYLLDIGKIPSIIDMRYKDGVALNYGK
ncbi:MAG: hypothetical protein EVA95_01085 [SAR86 cluster bacterium]|uniref:Cell division protein FtsQ/DivIB C-terminal domain-containing protein n=1 Tax=SAR86 cluster bacterium TaxID=2030880 RepID=A0A520N0N9_9GAMM|nr:MAG: hypothetical protein CBD85_002350 [Gammaproteobacteria bacterium TMED225]RZO27050.1 MAG: hypothetical protein EVA95_01085 [SAR86 cluster bacterium]|tara:strand:- start:1557 stop:2183 length:627 start_codon:yes stop_codon:yes gene_type:complete